MGLVWLGVWMRFSALALLVMTLVIEIFVYPNADESTAAIRRHETEFGMVGEAYRDPGHRLAG